MTVDRLDDKGMYVKFHYELYTTTFNGSAPSKYILHIIPPYLLPLVSSHKSLSFCIKDIIDSQKTHQRSRFSRSASSELLY